MTDCSLKLHGCKLQSSFQPMMNTNYHPKIILMEFETINRALQFATLQKLMIQFVKLIISLMETQRKFKNFKIWVNWNVTIPSILNIKLKTIGATAFRALLLLNETLGQNLAVRLFCLSWGYHLIVHWGVWEPSKVASCCKAVLG